jgi:multiple sugar transport system ATP-binding protein
MARLVIDGVEKSFGNVRVLEGIELDVVDGEFIVLLGPSGCGKSTLLNIIAGLERATSGTIRIGDRLVNEVEPKDRNIAMVFQSYALYPTMTVRENMTFGMECRGTPRAERDAAVQRVASLLQIGHLLDRKPAQLSGGQRQRVAMGRALVRDPDIFLFDEPLSNLDALLRVEMRTEIKKLHQRVGTTVVYVTHDQIEAMTLASRIAVMHKGRIQQLADPKTVYERPANLFVARFMGSPPMNTVPARLARGGQTLEAVLDGADGGAIRLPLPTANGAAAGYVDREVILGVRPECIVNEGRRAPDAGAGLASVDASVEVVEPTGAETMVVLRLGGSEVIGRVDPDLVPEVGRPMRFGIDMRKACLFDPRTEQLIP